eukprot:jgi/Galph1/1022/GphlegSOOS_G5891.1
MERTFYRYDKFSFNDSAFLIFLLSFFFVCSCLFLLYWILFGSWTLFSRHKQSSTHLTVPSLDICHCQRCLQKVYHFRENKKKSLGWKYFIFILVLLVSVILVYLVWSIPREQYLSQAPWDPFKILGVTREAGKDEIARAFRKLSLRYHPDKNPDDTSTAEMFIEIHKAYKTLTDAQAKENFIKFGNPDGFQGVTYGIGLPKILTKYDKQFLIIYLLCLVLGVPFGIGIWWKRSSQVLENGIRKNTIILFQQILLRSSSYRDIVASYASAFEFEHLIPKKLYPICSALMQQVKTQGHWDFRKSKLYNLPHMVSNQIILQAYISRISVPECLTSALSEMLSMLDILIVAMIGTNSTIRRVQVLSHWPASPFGGFASRLITILQVSQSLCQQLHPKESELLQVPYFTAKEVRRCHSKEFKVYSVYSLCNLDKQKLEKLLGDSSPSTILEVEQYLSRFPFITKMEVSQPTVEDEEDPRIFEGDIITLKVKFRVMNRCLYTTENEQEKWDIPKPPCLFYCPIAKPTNWWVLLIDNERDLPVSMKKLNFSDKDNTGTYNCHFQFPSPRAGSYRLLVKVINDSIFGCEHDYTVTMKIRRRITVPDNAADEMDEDKKDMSLSDDSSLEENSDIETEEDEDNDEQSIAEDSTSSSSRADSIKNE